MASNLFKALTTSLNRPSNSRSLCLVSGQISNHTAKWMQAESLRFCDFVEFALCLVGKWVRELKLDDFLESTISVVSEEMEESRKENSNLKDDPRRISNHAA
ncbi:hypothetical protein CK203_024440 [Vitis vinifera]|uniref:Uncharacterized protein n=1 Tax=Vitis vinifera TaxID=29760 RepID=A0A438E281_VITVI|nr:hypothetical protein CK203_107619 [Vitis vinifera]RVX01760.1 hypothetical protein CK203_024440 [Vitis vinifera]